MKEQIPSGTQEQSIIADVGSWAAKRPVTVSLTAFLLIWYLFELLVLHTYGAQTAEAWFYWQKPPVFPPQPHVTDVLLAPISHDLYTLTHIGANVGGLLIVGGYAEPRIGSKYVATLVIGLNYVGIIIANYTAFIHKTWMMAGISGGLLSLIAYTGLRSRNQFREALNHGLDFRSKTARRRFFEAVLFLLVPGILILEPLLIGFNSGHTTGIILGALYYLSHR